MITLWTTNDGYSQEAVQRLQRLGLPYEERRIGAPWTVDQLLASDPNATTSMPAFFLDGKYIGGLRELYQYLQQ
jgi:glutaredoxin